MASRRKAPPVVLSELLSSPCIAGIEESASRQEVRRLSLPFPSPLISADAHSVTIEQTTASDLAPRENLSSIPRDKLSPPPTDKLTVGPPDKLTAGEQSHDLAPFPPVKLTVVPPVKLTGDPPDALLYRTLDGAIVSSKCIRRYSAVQEGHKASEHLVYTTMWKMSGLANDREEFREALLGF